MNGSDSGQRYTVADLVYYGGLFGGIIITYKLTEPLAIHPIVRLIAGLVVGVGAGWGLERAFRSRGRRRPPGERDT